MKKARSAKSQKKKNIVLRVACAVFAVYVVVQVVSLQIQLHIKREQLSANLEEKHRLELYNESLSNKKDSDAYMEEKAYDMNYTKDGEQIYVIVADE